MRWVGGVIYLQRSSILALLFLLLLFRAGGVQKASGFCRQSDLGSHPGYVDLDRLDDLSESQISSLENDNYNNYFTGLSMN